MLNMLECKTESVLLRLAQDIGSQAPRWAHGDQVARLTHGGWMR